ncbi:MAG: hypothetical protein NTW12_14425 [Deltaproteobacteria bacterium]|nr:hypothetical protein [Deltaproteobacteria bacterium]
MNDEQYRKLCEACDQVLLAPDPTIERVSIPWLHVIREHPVFLSTYIDLFEPSKGGSSIVRKWWSFFRNRAGWFKQIMSTLRANGQPWFGPKELPRGVDFLFVSHLLNESHAGNAEDFYFAGLANELVARGHSAVIALINHTGKDAKPIAARWNGSPVPRVIISDSLRLLEEVTLRRRLKREFRRLRELTKKENPGLARRVLARAAEEALSGGSLIVLRMASQIGALTAILQPKAIVITYEGHAWERVAFASARRSLTDVRCIGYQHAALFKLQHAIRRNLSPQYNPDHILTAGEITQAQLSRSPGLRGIPVTVLGSNRGLVGHHEKDKNAGRKQRRIHACKPTCLVIPEGIASECDILFNFAIVCAQALPNIHFVWRLHPILSFEALAAKNQNFRQLPFNVEMSRMPIDQDLERCRWALYRGTTAVMQAVLSGLRPIYLKLADELSIDPLHELNTFRVTIESPEDFLRIINVDLNDDRNSQAKEFKVAYDYCRRYFLPWDVTVLANILSRVS